MRTVLLVGWYILLFFLYWAASAVIGGVIGSVVFPVVGLLIGYDESLLTMGWNGLRDGAFYVAIWGFGIALVLVYRHIYHRIKARGASAQAS